MIDEIRSFLMSRPGEYFNAVQVGESLGRSWWPARMIGYKLLILYRREKRINRRLIPRDRKSRGSPILEYAYI